MIEEETEYRNCGIGRGTDEGEGLLMKEGLGRMKIGKRSWRGRWGGRVGLNRV
jgi:hypothetical protein